MKSLENGVRHPKTIDEIYETLSSVDVNQWLETKMDKLDYLPWAIAVRLVKQECPDFEFTCKAFGGKGVQKYPADGEGYNTTCEVVSIIRTNGYEFEMWLPVMNHRFKSIVNPTSKDINDAKMRCSVKNIALNLGLGSYVFEGFKQPGLLKLENGVQSPSDKSNSFAPMNTTATDKTASQNISVSDAVVSPKDEGDVRNCTVLIGFGAGEKTYSEVYGTNVKNIDSQIEWVKSNGNGDKASQHLANLCQYKLMLTSRV